MQNIDVNPTFKKFRKTNLYYTTDDMLLYQDPTYLGFKIFIEPGSNGLFSNCIEGETNTAYSYLMNLGQIQRANYIKKFNELFSKINNLTPWFFQEITGLEKAWERRNSTDDYSPLIPKDSIIEIGCLESIDLRITTLIDLYRKGCFDWEFRREIVPINLRTFNISIYVYESRIINRTGLPLKSGLNVASILNIEPNKKQQTENNKLLGDDPFVQKDTLGNKLKSILAAGKEGVGGVKDAQSQQTSNKEVDTPNVHVNRILFKFTKCEFLPDKSGDFLAALKMSSAENEIGQKIAFSYRNVTEENLNNIYLGNTKILADAYTILDSLALDSSSIQDGISGGINSTISNSFGTILDGLKSAGAEKLSSFVNTNVGKLLMGNVFGLSPLNIANDVGQILSGDPNQALSGISDLAKQGAKLGEKAIRSINQRKSKNLGNIFK